MAFYSELQKKVNNKCEEFQNTYVSEMIAFHLEMDFIIYSAGIIFHLEIIACKWYKGKESYRQTHNL